MSQEPLHEELERLVRESEQAENDRRLAEEALRRSEEKFKSLFQNPVVGVFQTTPAGRFLTANRQLAEMYQYSSPKELIEQITDIAKQHYFDPLDRDIFKEALEKQGTIRNFEVRVLKKDGTPIWVSMNARAVKDDSGAVLHYEGITSDITERKLAEEALKHSEATYREIFNSVREALYIHDIETGEILDVNQAMLEIFGYTKDEVRGLTVGDISSGVPPYTQELAEELLKKAASGEPQIFEWHCRHKKGYLFWVETSLKRALIAGKECILAIERDITERKKLEIERSKLQEQLVKAQKREAIGVLAGGIAHDFNNILAGIIGYVEIAKAGLRNESRNADYLDRALKACDRAKSLVRQILAFGRHVEREIIPLQLEPIVKEVLSMLRSSLPASIEIRYSLATDLPVVAADPTQVQQVVMNLCMNAAHAIDDEQGVIEIGLDEIRLDEQGVGLLRVLSPGDYVRVRVSDTGAGIPSDILDKIFDPYFTTKKVGEGAGLGLAVVYGIVKEYGGDISVESEEGRGSTFTVLLPAEERIQGSDPGIFEPGSFLPLGREHILFVDDEFAIIDIGREQLEVLGYKVTTRSSPLEALELFRADPFRFDLVITDTAMPQMTGDRLALELLSIRPDIRIILCTGFSSRVSDRRAKEIGIRAFLMKPFSQLEMANTVRMLLDDDPGAGRE